MIRFLLFFVCVFVLTANVAQAQTTPHVTLALKAASSAAEKGETVPLALVQTIEKGWHTYWKNPGDSGEPMRLEWQLPESVTVGGLRWPSPTRVPYADLMNFGYENKAVILTELRVPQNFAGTSIEAKVNATILVCADICIPEDHEASLTLPIGKGQAVEADLFAKAEQALPQAVNWAVETKETADALQVVVQVPVSEAEAMDPNAVQLFPENTGLIDNAADQTIEIDDSGKLLLTLKRDETGMADSTNDLAYVLRTSATQAYALPVHPLSAAPKQVWEGGAESMPDLKTPLTKEERPSWLASICKLGQAPALPSYLYLLLLAVLGGVCLNLMPCVFPILSMKALAILKLNTQERAHARRSGLFYLLGVVSTFLAVGFVFLVLRSLAFDPITGEVNGYGWGYQLQEPLVVTLLAWLLFMVGLMLFGMVHFRVPLPGKLAMLTEETAGGAFASGILATLVATPCTGPFMATALGATIGMSALHALGIFAFLGLGLALPYVLLASFPVLQRLLPKPGAWMEQFAHILAWPMFASAVWLVWVGVQQGGADMVLPLMGGMWCIALAAWCLRRKVWWRVALAVAALFTLVWLGVMAWHANPDHRAKTAMEIAFGVRDDVIEWRPYTQADLTDVLATTQPVFINMTASWCITCKVNETVAIETDSTRNLFKENNVIAMKGDWTNRNADITAFLQRFNRNGVPLYVFYGAPDEVTGQRPQPVVLPQILTPGTLRGLFKQ